MNYNNMGNYNFMNMQSPYSMNQSNSNSTIQGNTIWVQGYEGANAFRTTPNSLFVLLDNNLERLYLKSTDNIGMCNGLRRFKLVEETEEVKPATAATLADYVRKDELKDLIMSLIPNGSATPPAQETVKEEAKNVQPVVRKSVSTVPTAAATSK